MYVRFPLSFRKIDDLTHERGIDIRHETVRIFDGLDECTRIAREAKVRAELSQW